MSFRLAFPVLAMSVLAAAPAHADDAKTRAIIGGQSRLAAIMAQQSALAPAAASITSAVPVVSADVRDDVRITRFAVSADRPDVFGSVAIPLQRTALDSRWSGVSQTALEGAAAGYAVRLRRLDALAQLEAINRYVNAHVRFIDDSLAFGVEDRWSSPQETFATGRGDCEDYALAKMAMARRAGFAERDLYLVVLKDLSRRADHAVLVVRADDRFLVLDNGTDQLIDSDQIRDYRPVLTFTRGQKFTHGYRRDPAAAPMIMASAGRIDSPARPAATTASYAAESRSLPVSMFAAPSPASAPLKR